jgi:hypothetical protein
LLPNPSPIPPPKVHLLVSCTGAPTEIWEKTDPELISIIEIINFFICNIFVFKVMFSSVSGCREVDKRA